MRVFRGKILVKGWIASDSKQDDQTEKSGKARLRAWLVCQPNVIKQIYGFPPFHAKIFMIFMTKKSEFVETSGENGHR